MSMWSNKHYGSKKSGKSRKVIFTLVIIMFIAVTSFFIFKKFKPISIDKQISSQLKFDESITDQEKQVITDAIKNQSITIDGTLNATVNTSTSSENPKLILSAYLPVMKVFSPLQNITSDELTGLQVSFLSNMDPIIKSAIIDTLNLDSESISTINSLDDLTSDEVAIIDSTDINSNVKLLSLNDSYYLDNFNSGAIFRTATFSGDTADSFSSLVLNELPNKDSILKVNQTGVTALTREMMNILNRVNDPLYFSEFIGEFLADADITHISNEVSFKEGCQYSSTAFCSDPRFIETLKASGVDLVELTGNHNNDVGSEYNTETINLYKSLGWNVTGGGLNAEDAAKYFVTDAKQSNVAFLAYNYPDSPNGLAIAGTNSAGANSFDFDKIKSDIDKAKQQSSYVIVDVQYWECYAYPEGYIEFPECDLPIGEQEVVFKKIIDLGADMVVGTQAHQPQTFEIYNGKPIYYGLGNLYFDQSYWPGTERGIVLTHYLKGNELIQTKLTPTVYDKSLQTKIMAEPEAESFLARLNQAR